MFTFARYDLPPSSSPPAAVEFNNLQDTVIAGLTKEDNDVVETERQSRDEDVSEIDTDEISVQPEESLITIDTETPNCSSDFPNHSQRETSTMSIQRRWRSTLRNSVRRKIIMSTRSKWKNIYVRLIWKSQNRHCWTR